MRSSALATACVLACACGGKKSQQPAIDAAPATPCTAKHGANLKLTEIATGLSQPLLVTAPKGDPRIFIVEQPGRVRMIGADGVLRSAAYLDLGDKVLMQGAEQGLLGLAFHPDFAKNGKLYVDYTQQPDGSEVLAEYTVDPAAETVQGQPRVLITQTDPAPNHNGGMIQFGPDRYLYMSIGDGGGGGDTYHNGQNMQTLMAKVLRIDPDHPGNGKPYGIPADNPWANGPGVPEMYAWGLRNPWRYWVDSNGDLYIGDVGQNTMEEIDVVPHGTSGQDFGWPVFEGTSCFGDPNACANAAPYTAPVIAYDRTQSGQCAVMGGLVYRGTCMPDYVGTYFWSDYCSGEIETFVYANGQATQQTNRTSQIDPQGLVHGQVASFGVDGYDELYVTALSAGKVYRIEVE